MPSHTCPGVTLPVLLLTGQRVTDLHPGVLREAHDPASGSPSGSGCAAGATTITPRSAHSACGMSRLVSGSLMRLPPSLVLLLVSLCGLGAPAGEVAGAQVCEASPAARSPAAFLDLDLMKVICITCGLLGWLVMHGGGSALAVEPGRDCGRGGLARVAVAAFAAWAGFGGHDPGAAAAAASAGPPTRQTGRRRTRRR